MTITGDSLLAAHAAALTSGFGSSVVVIGARRMRGLLDDAEGDRKSTRLNSSHRL